MLVLGLNYKQSSIECLEHFSFSKACIASTLAQLKNEPVFRGCIIVSTCNRVELYISSDDNSLAQEKIVSLLSRFGKDNDRFCLSQLYAYRDTQAVFHLCRVLCGLDSMVIGETQIVGQVKQALAVSHSCGMADDYLHERFSKAFSVSREVRRKTSLTAGKISVGSVAIDLIRDKLGSIKGKNILILGVGKISSLVVQYLSSQETNVIFIANRTYEKARALAQRIGAQALRYESFDAVLPAVDIIISATASPHYIIKKDRLANHRAKQLLIVDLAMPRDVDPYVRTLSYVELIDIYALRSVIQRNTSIRHKNAQHALRLLNQQVNHETMQNRNPVEPSCAYSG